MINQKPENIELEEQAQLRLTNEQRAALKIPTVEEKTKVLNAKLNTLQQLETVEELKEIAQ